MFIIISATKKGVATYNQSLNLGVSNSRFNCDKYPIAYDVNQILLWVLARYAL